jgi:RHS repeat-associated protein
MGAPNNGAGQVMRSEDGSRIQTNMYDQAGNIVNQATTMKLHNWTPAADQSTFTWTTQWQYDGLGRLKSMVYPDTERLTYGYDAGGQLNFISGEEDGYEKVLVGTDPVTGQPIYNNVPRTWHYEYLRDRQYDEFLRRRYDVNGNGVTTALTFDADTQWLTHQLSVSPNRNVGDQGDAFKEIQDLSYTYDKVGNPLTYRNDVPGPTSSLFSGPTKQSYTYDPYERIIAAKGDWQQATGKLRQYDLKLTYDSRGNVTSKTQKDWIQDGNKQLIQTETTYSFTRTYNRPQPHQATGETNKPYTYDANGNLTGVLDSKGKFIREVAWDAADRMRKITDGPQVTDYTYDDSGQRSIERGPAGETATLNPWVTVRNASEIFKHVWAGNDRIGTQRDDGGIQEVKQYFLHKDLQGSTNIVTDITGKTFQHHEYFATGEVWVDEKSTVFRTPYQYGGGYVDEQRKIINFGARWYDPNREMFYSPDPVLYDDPMAVVGTPALRAAYAYAGSNPLTYIDPGGREFTEAQREFNAKLAQNPELRKATLDQLHTRLPKSFVRLGLDIEQAERRQELFEKIDGFAKSFVEINISTGEVLLSGGIFTAYKQWEVRKGKTNTGNQAGAAKKTVTFASGTKPAAPTGNGSVQPPNSGKSTAAPSRKVTRKPLPPLPATKGT